MVLAPENLTADNQSDEFGANDWLIEEMYQAYRDDPASVDGRWQEFFAEREGGAEGAAAPTASGASLSASDAPAKTAPDTEPDVAKPAAKPDAKAGPVKAEQSKAEQSKNGATTPKRDNARDSYSVVADTKPRSTTSRPAAPAAKPAGDEAAGKPARVESSAGARHDLAPESPGSGMGLSANRPSLRVRREAASEPTRTQLKGAPMRTARNMDASLAMPTATSVRNVPMKLAIDQRQMVNSHLARTTGGKISFTHLIGFAMIQALKQVPAMNNAYEEADGKPFLVEPNTINLGLAIDLPRPDGGRQLLVPNIKGCEDLNFGQFWAAYEAVVRKARAGKLEVSDFQGTTATLTNPGGIGTSHSVPRLMAGQGLILGVGSIDYPPEFQGASMRRINEAGVSKVTTLTSTYDHRIIQGAQSGEFLKVIHELLLGKHGFYDDIFASLRIPYAPIRWAQDVSAERPGQIPKSARVFSLIAAYRQWGHLMADIDPLEYRQRSHPELTLEYHGLTLWDLDREFPVGNFGGHDGEVMPLRDILSTLRGSYCRSVGIEYMHIQDNEQRAWIQKRVEVAHAPWPREEHLRILDRLNEAEIFETFLQTKFVGQKRFSLEGGESTIVLLDELCDAAANSDLDEVVIGMPHRGRLNVLANIVGKSYGQIFKEFEGNVDPRLAQGTGDVKYHLGAEGQFTALSGKTIKTSVAANPSHLEAVDPVVEGIARAKLDQLGAPQGYPVLPILLHGDASFAGQGVVYETLQMSQLRPYRTGGTVHVVVNNQVGFTTAPLDSRTSVYCTDVAKTIQAPIFHVNGDDPEAVARVAQLAFEYRQRFNKDVVLDVICYRRRGHNEGDDPSFTQPRMYDLIEQKRSVRKLYTEALIGRGDISTEDAEAVLTRFRDGLERVFKKAREDAEEDESYRKVPYYPPKLGKTQGTAITAEVLEKVARAHETTPDGFTVHPKVRPQLQRRADGIRNGPIDWATGELLAFGSLLLEGRPVRLVGQDTRRGTFVQRFATVIDRNTAEAYVPLNHLGPDQGTFYVYDSLLSEYAAMGFEYGYSVAAPDALVCWEAQFGDFANGAQVVTDEFIASGNAKWTQKSGVVLMLPHGYEGQGPDHSSARIERWLQLCHEGALAVCQPSTPASYFHLLRTHAYVNWHRPVVIATPKSMLRSKQAASQPSDFTHGRWEPATGDPTITDRSKVTKILICSGKIRWDLVTARAEAGLEGSVAILSLERLYPLPAKELAAQLAEYPRDADVRFVQDEPENQGPWWFMEAHLPQAVAAFLPGYQLRMTPVTRPAASAPSVGSLKIHRMQQDELLERALAD
ncbi:multifunctional oxoglutarate decarboxylase/oxoglutarate dehydrogenase thiamine pyrophosphate-binding subunit/dihydrolipoyllysine-residue succinyltransferase subunit [Micropruina sonneratiae]|uniref:multifunctional oxoglutarate decarboxylase/oxoglutarate dehydrogenase thiamine pyrophosphate-binding subunit/dihydrolipoyllysine-residue succinyltransferase subunit n=1 Tax=Micropruina sonneratiae TaxID=2986940 RepID=UPI0022273398|nr:multifunctional oxoglutarate decarboxylase/oxoglutarate dehydrogenase thiamine pyrophosphate-binding subunit/dihydrolipoyllysine-residue succinyltransferase subunit [Micropruina sp. KQZ13P-5]MCW3157517.1 multifunctional oxoglutarate decarboxylase/oxoglutarate dehydrogenase thiamine pyrophosphate-binding subunit/dihydrolipoyllysine-residue succinyltransferase subunit [Micropruina sp. KQZ13P-5]